MLCCTRGQHGNVPELIVVVNPDDGGLMFATKENPPAPVHDFDVALSMCETEGLEYVGAVHMLTCEECPTRHVGFSETWQNFKAFCVECMVPP